MSMLDYDSYDEAREKFEWSQAWEVFDGNPDSFNMGHECVDRHVGKGTAIRIKFSDRHKEEFTFDQLSRWSSQFAQAIEVEGIDFQERVAIMLDPCIEYYTSLFGTMKRGAIAVPCYKQFGPDAIEYRLQDSGARLLITDEEALNIGANFSGVKVITVGPQFNEFINGKF